jgi:hypothetical protein
MNNQLIIHISAELIIIGTVSYYFNRKVNALKTEIDELRKRCSDYENKFDKITRNMDVLYGMINELKRSSQSPPATMENPQQELRQRRPSQRGLPQENNSATPVANQRPVSAGQRPVSGNQRPVGANQRPVPVRNNPQKRPNAIDLPNMILGSGIENFFGVSISPEQDLPEVEEVHEEQSEDQSPEQSDEEFDEEDLDNEIKDELDEIAKSSKKQKK